MALEFFYTVLLFMYFHEIFKIGYYHTYLYSSYYFIVFLWCLQAVGFWHLRCYFILICWRAMHSNLQKFLNFLILILWKQDFSHIAATVQRMMLIFYRFWAILPFHLVLIFSLDLLSCSRDRALKILTKKTDTAKTIPFQAVMSSLTSSRNWNIPILCTSIVLIEVGMYVSILG